MNWIDLNADYKQNFPDEHWLIRILIVTWASISLPILVWWAVDFLIFRSRVKIFFRKLMMRIKEFCNGP